MVKKTSIASSEAVIPAGRQYCGVHMISLGEQKRGFQGVISKIDSVDEDNRFRLLIMGFVEGAKVKILHEALFGDPIAVRINDSSTVALRRNEANCIKIEE